MMTVFEALRPVPRPSSCAMEARRSRHSWLRRNVAGFVLAPLTVGFFVDFMAGTVIQSIFGVNENLPGFWGHALRSMAEVAVAPWRTP